LSGDSPFLEKFCRLLKEFKIEEAAEIVEEAAKNLHEIKGITPTALSRMRESMKKEIHNKVDAALLKSELLEMNLPFISEAFAEAVHRAASSPQKMDKIRKLITALVNFYKYYQRNNSTGERGEFSVFDNIRKSLC